MFIFLLTNVSTSSFIGLVQVQCLCYRGYNCEMCKCFHWLTKRCIVTLPPSLSITNTSYMLDRTANMSLLGYQFTRLTATLNTLKKTSRGSLSILDSSNLSSSTALIGCCIWMTLATKNPDTSSRDTCSWASACLQQHDGTRDKGAILLSPQLQHQQQKKYSLISVA